MGYASLLDILGSILIGGFLMLIAWRLSEASTEKTHNFGGELSLQQNLLTVAQMIEHDFRKIGWCADFNKWPDPTKSIPYGNVNDIKFYTDVDSDGNIDSIRYYLGPTSELLETPNPRDRVLYRVVNNETPMPSNLGVTQFRLVYYNVFDDTIPTPVTVPGLISSIEINLSVENVAAYDTAYSNAFWRQIRLASRNINTR